MQLEKIDIYGVSNVYALSTLKKEFRKAVNEPWKDNPPWERYQKKLIEDLAVLDDQMQCAINLPQFEKISEENNLYSIRHPESKKNIRILYTIVENNTVILLVAFLEKNISDYKNAINRAKQRIKWLEND